MIPIEELKRAHFVGIVGHVNLLMIPIEELKHCDVCSFTDWNHAFDDTY